MTYEFVTQEEIDSACDPVTYASLCDRLLAERNAYRKSHIETLKKHNIIKYNRTYGFVDAEAARILEGK